MKHESHNWVELSPDEDGEFCEECEICTCHSPDLASTKCEFYEEEND